MSGETQIDLEVTVGSVRAGSDVTTMGRSDVTIEATTGFGQGATWTMPKGAAPRVGDRFSVVIRPIEARS